MPSKSMFVLVLKFGIKISLDIGEKLSQDFENVGKSIQVARFRFRRTYPVHFKGFKKTRLPNGAEFLYAIGEGRKFGEFS